MAFTSLRSIAVASVLAAVAVAAPAANADSPIPGYAIVPATWEIDGPDGQVVQLNGTVQEVMTQLEGLFPDSQAKLLADIEARSATSPREESPLERRYDEESLHCWERWSNARVYAIQDGINYLNNVPGRPWHNPGPSTCARVSCSWDSAIYWCNDNNFRKELNSYKDIAHGADRIKDTCNAAGVLWRVTLGQMFYKDKWNVIVRGDSC